MPYHDELHDILIRKGFNYQKYEYLFDAPADHYRSADGMTTLIFYEDETITTIGICGDELSIEEFDELTNYIFAEGRDNGKDAI